MRILTSGKSGKTNAMGQERDTFWQLERDNRRRTVELVLIFILIYFLVGASFDFLLHRFVLINRQPIAFPMLTVAATVIAVAQALRAYYAGLSVLLGAVGAQDLTGDSAKTRMVGDIVDEMAVAARIPRPRLCLMEDPAPNAFAAGRDPAHSVICVTRGLVNQLDREELQAVIAHEMAHIRGHDTRIMQMAAVMVGGFALLSATIVRKSGRQEESAGIPRFGVFGIVVFIISGIGWLCSKAAAIALSRQREYLADASAVEFTRNPLALIRALEHIARIELPLAAVPRAMAPIFIVDPFQCGAGSWEEYLDEIAEIESQPGKSKVQRDAELVQYISKGEPPNFFHSILASHPPIHDRLERLRALIRDPAAPLLSEAEVHARRRAAAKTLNEITAAGPEVMAAAIEAMVKAKSSGQQGMRTAGENAPGEFETRNALEHGEQGAEPSYKLDPAWSQAAGANGMVDTDRIAAILPAKTSSDTAASRTLLYLFWIVIALSAGAIAAALAALR
jgi:heat shock protein HtpX